MADSNQQTGKFNLLLAVIVVISSVIFCIIQCTGSNVLSRFSGNAFSNVGKIIMDNDASVNGETSVIPFENWTVSMSDLSSTPAVVTPYGIVILRSNNKVHMLNRKNGDVIWTIDAECKGLFFQGDFFGFTGKDGWINCTKSIMFIDCKTGQVKHVEEKGQMSGIEVPVTVGGNFYFFTQKHGMASEISQKQKCYRPNVNLIETKKSILSAEYKKVFLESGFKLEDDFHLDMMAQNSLAEDILPIDSLSSILTLNSFETFSLIDAVSGKIRWIVKRDGKACSKLQCSGDFFYILTGENRNPPLVGKKNVKIHIYEVKTGRLVKTVDISEGLKIQSPIISNNNIWWEGANGELNSFNFLTEKLNWTVHFGGISSSLFRANDKIMFYANGKDFYFIDENTGDLLDKIELAGADGKSMAFSDGLLTYIDGNRTIHGVKLHSEVKIVNDIEGTKATSSICKVKDSSLMKDSPFKIAHNIGVKLPEVPDDPILKWYFDTTVNDYLRVQIHSNTWNQQAIDALWLTGRQFANNHLKTPITVDKQALLERYSILVNDLGCANPMVLYGHYVILHKLKKLDQKLKFGKAEEIAYALEKTNCSPFRKCHMFNLAASNYFIGSGRNKKGRKKKAGILLDHSLEIMKEVLRDKKIPEGTLYTTAKYLNALLVFQKRDTSAIFEQIYTNLFYKYRPLSAASLIQKANDNKKTAWRHRGNAAGYKVTREGFINFKKYLELAENNLIKADAVLPEEEDISVKMLSICIGLGKDKKTMNLWFNKAITADPNCISAYKMKAEYLLPKWYGSKGECWKFFDSVLETAEQNEDISEIVEIIGPGHVSLAKAECNGSWEAYYKYFRSNPKIWSQLNKTSETLRQMEGGDNIRDLANHFIYAVLCKQEVVATKLVVELEKKYIASAYPLFSQHGLDPKKEFERLR